jgi:hypothetical protein
MMSDRAAVMNGFPPQDGGQVTLANWREPPYNRWAFHHVSQIVPCAMVWCDGEARADWQRNETDITGIKFSFAGEQRTVSEMLHRTTTDGLVVIHQGRLVHESYYAGLGAQVPHILFSVTKSVVGLLAGILVGRGQLDPEREISAYLPETAGSGYADATVRQLLDMLVGIGFEEDYEATEGDMVRYREATGWSTGSTEQAVGLRRFLATLPPAGDHGRVFKYCSPNTDLLGWVLERAAKQPFAELLSEALWRPMGARCNAYIGVDGFGAPRTSGGLCTTTRDLARLGQLVLDGGEAGGRQVVPADWIRDIYDGGDRETWKGGSFARDMPDVWYRSKWYKHGAGSDAISGFGIYGQALFVHPSSRTVIAKHSSQPRPLDFALDAMQTAAFLAIAAELG